jgi:hypothetical protein
MQFMGGGEPVLSIVVPTKDRSDYAWATIRSLCRIAGFEIEIIVTDTSETDALGQRLLRELGDARVKYCHSSPSLSMTDNFNRGLSEAQGAYICIIGDDDSVTSEILPAAEWALAHDIDAIVILPSASYYWPDFRTRFYGSRHAGKLYIRSFSAQARLVDTQAALRRAADSAGQDFVLLPKIYHGIIRRQSLEAVRTATGSYLKSASPDVYGAIVIANSVRSVVCVDYPLTLPGSSKRSNAGRSAQRQHTGSLKGEAHLSAYQDLAWPDIIPSFFSVETLWASAALEAFKQIDRSDLIKRFGVGYLYGVSLVKHPNFLVQVLKSISSAHKLAYVNLKVLYIQIMLGAVRTIGEICMWVIKRMRHPAPRGDAYEVSNLKDTQAGVVALEEWLQGRNCSITDVLKTARVQDRLLPD